MTCGPDPREHRQAVTPTHDRVPRRHPRPDRAAPPPALPPTTSTDPSTRPPLGRVPRAPATTLSEGLDKPKPAQTCRFRSAEPAEASIGPASDARSGCSTPPSKRSLPHLSTRRPGGPPTDGWPKSSAEWSSAASAGCSHVPCNVRSPRSSTVAATSSRSAARSSELKPVTPRSLPARTGRAGRPAEAARRPVRVEVDPEAWEGFKRRAADDGITVGSRLGRLAATTPAHTTLGDANGQAIGRRSSSGSPSTTTLAGIRPIRNRQRHHTRQAPGSARGTRRSVVRRSRDCDRQRSAPPSRTVGSIIICFASVDPPAVIVSKDISEMIRSSSSPRRTGRRTRDGPQRRSGGLLLASNGHSGCYRLGRSAAVGGISSGVAWMGSFGRGEAALVRL